MLSAGPRKCLWFACASNAQPHFDHQTILARCKTFSDRSRNVRFTKINIWNHITQFIALIFAINNQTEFYFPSYQVKTMPWTPKIGFGNDLKCSFVSLYISEFIAITYLPRSFALPAFSRTEHENKMFANVHRTTLTFTKKKLEITSCLKSSKSGKSWFWKYWLRWVKDGRCTTSYHVTWVQSYILIVFLRCKIGIQYANAKFTGRNLPLKCFLPLPQSVATGGLVDDLGLRSKSPRKQSQRWGAVHIHLSAHRQHTRTRRQVDPRLL